MPYKIYTYEDPYKLDQTDFWDEISCLPHFCVARTMVNGLKDVMQDSIQGLICPLDNLVSFPPEDFKSKHEVYRSWTENISLRIQQYSALTTIFKRELENHNIDEKFYQALQQNQTYFLEAIRLFIELGIGPDSLDAEKGNKEQRLFTFALKEVSKDPLFSFPHTPTVSTLKEIITELAQNELREYDEKNTGSQKDRLWYERAIKNTADQPLKAIVVHGVHQFSPPQLRLLLDMEKMGITIIFLFNYQKQFPKMYSSWEYIYKCFDAPIHHDANIGRYEMQMMQNASNALGCALGEMYEGHYQSRDSHFQKWHGLYKNVNFIEFANITEYAHFVSNHFDVAQKKYRDTQSVIDRGNDVLNHAAVLRFLDEQVYTANRDVHTLLKIYYPEYAKERHFLSYPIGQFFSAIYRLWDYERGEIKIDIPAIKECLSSHILTAGSGESLLRTFYNLDIIFDGITTFEEFREKIATEYVSHYNSVTRSRAKGPIYHLRQLSIYNKYKVTKKDITTLVNAIEEINEIAKHLFAVDDTHEVYISFGKHFENLEAFLKRRDLSLANEEERTLIDALRLRLDKVKPEKSFSGTFRDLQEGLYFYLKQKNSEEGVDWIVKNFEQIDGDILQSRGQKSRGEEKVYHFACLSDRDLNCKVDDLLPWPLTESFIRKAYAPIDLQFQVYYTALGERESFLRYALFYGLCYNYCDVRLSYVKQYSEETTEPYAMLPVLGLKPSSGVVDSIKKPIPYSINVGQEPTKSVRYNRNEMMSMFLCPYRFFLDYVMEDAPVQQGSFLYQKFYENCLVDAVWKRIGGQPKESAIRYLERVIAQESAIIRPYFSFWKQTETLDLERRAKNYLLHEIIGESTGEKIRPYQESHMDMRRMFGKAKFYIDITESEPKNPYESFENLAKREYPQKIYSLYSLPKPDKRPADKARADELCNTTKQYINQVYGKDKTAIPADWCHFCVHRGVCMESFLTIE